MGNHHGSHHARHTLEWLVRRGAVKVWRQRTSGSGKIVFDVIGSDGKTHEWTCRNIEAFYAGYCAGHHCTEQERERVVS